MEYQLTEPINDFFMWGFLILFLSSAFFLLTFAQFTMRRIEREIKRDVIDYVKPVNVGDGGLVSYAFAIVLPERPALRLAHFLDVELIRTYATKTDWWLSLLFLLTMDAWILFAIIFYIWENF
jgi:hypothetical protein